jgi:hypothetical protein
LVSTRLFAYNPGDQDPVMFLYESQTTADTMQCL